MIKANYYVAKETHFVEILSERNKKQNAFALAIKTLSKAKKYELTDYCLLLSPHLIINYSLISPNKTKRKLLGDKISNFESIQRAELLVEKYYFEHSYMCLTQKMKFGEIKLDKMITYSEELMTLQSKISSFKFNLDSYNIITSYYILS